MIDFEALINKHAGDDGNIPAANVTKLVTAISSAVGREFIPKDRYNAKLDEITKLEQEKQDAADKLTAAEKTKKKLDDLKAEYDKYKSDTEAKARLNDVKAAYRAVLKDAGIADKYLDTVIAATRFDDMKLNDDGKLDKADEHKTAAEQKWADFKVKSETKGAPVETPPAKGAPAGRTKEEIMAIKDAAERQKAIAENHELFGF